MPYLYPGDEYFLSSIVSWGYNTIEKDVGSFIKDESCTIAKSLLEWEASQEHDDHAFLYEEVMWRESNRSDLVQEFHRNLAESLGSLVLSALDRMPHSIQ